MYQYVLFMVLVFAVAGHLACEKFATFSSLKTSYTHMWRALFRVVHTTTLDLGIYYRRFL